MKSLKSLMSLREPVCLLQFRDFRDIRDFGPGTKRLSTIGELRRLVFNRMNGTRRTSVNRVHKRGPSFHLKLAGSG